MIIVTPLFTTPFGWKSVSEKLQISAEFCRADDGASVSQRRYEHGILNIGR